LRLGANSAALSPQTGPRSDARRLTWIALTPAGRNAFGAHLRALQEIAGITD
jgi:hypothetical protein